jgi:hypothetical protein
VRLLCQVHGVIPGGCAPGALCAHKLPEGGQCGPLRQLPLLCGRLRIPAANNRIVMLDCIQTVNPPCHKHDKRLHSARHTSAEVT